MTIQLDLCFTTAYPCTFDVTTLFHGAHIRKSFVVGLDAAEQPLILVCLLTALSYILFDGFDPHNDYNNIR